MPRRRSKRLKLAYGLAAFPDAISGNHLIAALPSTDNASGKTVINGAEWQRTLPQTLEYQTTHAVLYDPLAGERRGARRLTSRLNGAID